MRIATWNLNNRVGKTRFRLDAAEAAIALGVDVLVFTEYFPQQNDAAFCARLSNAGWTHQLTSAQPREVANRVLIASKLELAPLPIELPTFDQQFPANVLGARLPSFGVSILGVRVPAYTGAAAHLLVPAWEWLERTAASLKAIPAVLLGDLNVAIDSRGRCGAAIRRIVSSGWQVASGPNGPTYFGQRGRNSAIDHILATGRCVLSDAACIQTIDGFVLCGSLAAISDHAALVCTVDVSAALKYEAEA